MLITFLVVTSSVLVASDTQNNVLSSEDDVIDEQAMGHEAGGLSLSIRLVEERDKSIQKAGYPVEVIVRITNVSDKRIFLVETTAERDFTFVIKDKNKKSTTKTRYGMRGTGITIGTIKIEKTSRKSAGILPGKYLERTINIGRSYDLTLSGEYEVQALRKVLKDDRGKTPDSSDLISNRITLDIR